MKGPNLPTFVLIFFFPLLPMFLWVLCRSRRTHFVLHFPRKTSCFFKLAYSMSSIPLYVTRGTCFLLQYAIFYSELLNFRVVLRGVTKLSMFSLLQAASKARERNPGKSDHRYIQFNRFLVSSCCLLVNSFDQRKFRIMCFFSRKIE